MNIDLLPMASTTGDKTRGYRLCEAGQFEPSVFLIRQRYRLVPQAILVGLLTGVVAVAFHFSLDFGETVRNRIIDWARQRPGFGPWVLLGLAFSATTIAAGLVIRFSPEASGSGVPHLKGVLLGHRPFRWLRVLLIKFASTFVGVTGGLVLGRGGPSVHMGGAIGQGVANLWRGTMHEDRPILVAAGGGAGLATAFNAPLAGLVFVLEELEWRCASVEFLTAAVACFSADMVDRELMGQSPIFDMVVAGAPPLNLLIAFVPLGILSAVLGGMFVRALLSAQRLMRLPFWSRLAWWMILAALVAIFGWLTPELLGGGQVFLNNLLGGKQFMLPMAAGYFAIRFGLTIGGSSSGAAGGIFIPVLVLGALLGWCIGDAAHLLFPELNVNFSLFAVVGMAAYFTGVVHAPLTGIVLVIEMTGNYSLILPSFIACFTALLIADAMGNLPVYEALLENGLRRDRFRQSVQ